MSNKWIKVFTDYKKCYLISLDYIAMKYADVHVESGKYLKFSEQWRYDYEYIMNDDEAGIDFLVNSMNFKDCSIMAKEIALPGDNYPPFENWDFDKTEEFEIIERGEDDKKYKDIEKSVKTSGADDN